MAVGANLIQKQIANPGLDYTRSCREPSVRGPLKPSVATEVDQTVLFENFCGEVPRTDGLTILPFRDEGIAIVADDVGVVREIRIIHNLSFLS